MCVKTRWTIFCLNKNCYMLMLFVDQLLPLDFSKFEKMCERKPLEKNFINVKRIPISNCISVTGFSNDVSESALENYFEDEKKSGGKNLTDIKLNHEDNTCLVYFEDHRGKIIT